MKTQRSTGWVMDVCESPNNGITAACAGVDSTQCWQDGDSFTHAMNCVNEGSYALSGGSDTTATAGHLGDCGEDAMLNGFCSSGSDANCNGVYTRASCTPLVPHAWEEVPAWDNATMGGFWNNYYLWNGPVGTFGSKHPTKAQDASNVSICPGGYVASAICNSGNSASDCLGIPDINAAYIKRGKQDWSGEPHTFLKCGKLKPSQATFMEEMSQ